MRELYGALDSDLRLLSAIGIRTCFDIAAIILGVDASIGFGRKLERLVELGKIGVVDKERLSVLIDAGSASVHRGWTPRLDDLNTMVDVLEHFVYEAFVAPGRRTKLDEKAKELKAKVPVRKKT
jgi:hypothetical protein